MTYLEWNDTYSVGIKLLDDHHKKLINIINELYDGIGSGDSEKVLRKTLSELVDYTKYHFTAEESLMSQYDYPEYLTHKESHQKLLKTLSDLQQQYAVKKGSLTIILKIENFLRHWLINHIMESDKKYGPYLNSKGVT